MQRSFLHSSQQRATRVATAALIATALPAAAQNHFDWTPIDLTHTEWTRAANWDDLDGTPFAFPHRLDHIAVFTEADNARTVTQDAGFPLTVGGLEFWRFSGRGRNYRFTGSALHLGAYGIQQGIPTTVIFDLDLALLAPQAWSFASVARFGGSIDLREHDLSLQGSMVLEQRVLSSGGRIVVSSGSLAIERADALAGVAVSGGTVNPGAMADSQFGNLTNGARVAPLGNGQIVRAGSLGGDGHIQALSGLGSFVKQGGGSMRIEGDTMLGGNGVFVDGGVLVATGTFADTAITVRSSGRFEAAAGARISLGDASMTINSGRTAVLSGGTLEGGFLRGAGTLQVGSADQASTVQRLRTVNGSRIEFIQGASNFRLVEHGGRMTVGSAARVNVDDVRVGSGGVIEVQGLAFTRNLESSGVLRVAEAGRIDNVTGQIVLAAGSRSEVLAGGVIDLNGQSLELNGGLLVNNGRIEGLVNVNYGSLAKGAGYYEALVVGDGGRVIAGNSPGRLQVGALDWGVGGHFDVQIADADAAPGTGWGHFDVDGALTIGAGLTPASRFTLAVATLDAMHAPGLAADFDAQRAYRWTLVDAGAIHGFDAGRFALDLSGFRNAYDGTFSLHSDGGRLDLVYVPVPEPETWALLALGLAALSLRRLRGARAD